MTSLTTQTHYPHPPPTGSLPAGADRSWRAHRPLALVPAARAMRSLSYLCATGSSMA